MLTPLEELFAFEHEVDRQLFALPISQRPARVFLTGIHRYLFQARNAEILGLEPMPGMAERIAVRLSSLLPLISGLPAEPFDGSASEATRAFMQADPDGQQLGALLQYMQFAETMPEAHKNWYEVSRRGETFELTHRSSAFSEFEARDILLSELGLVFPLDLSRARDPEIETLADTTPKLHPELLAKLLARKAERLSFGMAEPNLVTEKGMTQIFGFKYKTFYRIRAVLLAYAELCVDMARTLAKRDRAAGLLGSSGETLEWVSVSHEAASFAKLVASMSGASTSHVERMLHLLSIDFRTAPARHHGGDGFFPPFARFVGGYVFSPELVLTQTHLRNLVFAYAGEQKAAAEQAKVVAKTKGETKRKNLFDIHVSRDFETVLVGQTEEFLKNSGSWITRPNVRFRNDGDQGEIDLIVAGPAGRALLLQAKGMMSPHGARRYERQRPPCGGKFFL